jgi:hypothetical protein
LELEDDMVFPSPCPTLKFTWRMLELVHSSLVNLMRCPAWQQCRSRVSISLGFAGPPEQLMGALAPLAGKEVSLSINDRDSLIEAPAVQQLGATLGNSLRQLVLEACELSPDFWPAVWAHLPGLQQLTVSDQVKGASSATELAVFCSRAMRPLQLNLGPGLLEQVGGKLEEQCQVWGGPQVTVAEF